MNPKPYLRRGVVAPTLSVPDLETEALNVLGERFRPLATAAETGGALTILEWTSPAESQLPRHCHTSADEAFYILEGEVAFTADGGFAETARPGDFVFLPKEIAHTHRATGGRPSRAYQVLTPGGIEAGLAEVARLSPADVTPQRLAELAATVGLVLLPEA